MSRGKDVGICMEHGSGSIQDIVHFVVQKVCHIRTDRGAKELMGCHTKGTRKWDLWTWETTWGLCMGKAWEHKKHWAQF